MGEFAHDVQTDEVIRLTSDKIVREWVGQIVQIGEGDKTYI